MLRSSWTLLRDAAMDFVDDNALSRGAAIAYYTTFSLGPVLVIVIAIAASCSERLQREAPSSVN